MEGLGGVRLKSRRSGTRRSPSILGRVGVVAAIVLTSLFTLGSLTSKVGAVTTPPGDSPSCYAIGLTEPVGDVCTSPPGTLNGGLDVAAYCATTYGPTYVAIVLGGNIHGPGAANDWACQDQSLGTGGVTIAISTGPFNTMCAQQIDPNDRAWALDDNDAYTWNCYLPYGTIAGQVTDATTGKGIPSACVQVITPTGARIVTLTANSTGNFDGTVKAGSYKLITYDPGCSPGTHAGTYYGGAPNYDLLSPNATTVTMTAKGSFEGLNVALPEAGTIAGTASTPQSKAVAGICAYAIDAAAQQMRGYAATNLAGQYSIVGLPPSSYNVAFTACPGGSDPYAVTFAPNAPLSTSPPGSYSVTANAVTIVNDAKF